MSRANEPAYPVQGQPYGDVDGMSRPPHEYGWMVEPSTGMTKREMFAAMAMQSLLVSSGPSARLAEQARIAASYLISELDK